MLSGPGPDRFAVVLHNRRRAVHSRPPERRQRRCRLSSMQVPSAVSGAERLNDAGMRIAAEGPSSSAPPTIIQSLQLRGLFSAAAMRLGPSVRSRSPFLAPPVAVLRDGWLIESGAALIAARSGSGRSSTSRSTRLITRANSHLLPSETLAAVLAPFGARCGNRWRCSFLAHFKILVSVGDQHAGGAFLLAMAELAGVEAADSIPLSELAPRAVHIAARRERAGQTRVMAVIHAPPRHLRQEGRTIMTRIADDFDAIRRRLAELVNERKKLTTITPANSPQQPLGSPTQSPSTQGRTCRSCGAIRNFMLSTPPLLGLPSLWDHGIAFLNPLLAKNRCHAPALVSRQPAAR